MAAPSNQARFYSDAKTYWAQIDPTVDGMLGGFAKISPTDINGSKAFLRPYLKIAGGKVTPNRALDCGAGIGRITKRFLLPIFDSVDMVEQDEHFCNGAKEFIGAESARVGDIHCVGLQNFTPPESYYDVIWCQWVLGHLEDPDLVDFFKRCKKGLKEDGIICLKENTLGADDSDSKAFDDSDSSYTRTKEELEKCIQEAGLTILSMEKQKGFPKQIFPVYMFALQ